MEPKKLKILKQADGILFVYKWRRDVRTLLALVFSGIFVSSIVFSMIEILFNIPAMLFSLLFLSVGLIVFYSQLCWFINSTRFYMSGTSLSISTFPLPWPKSNRVLDLSEIKEICTEVFNGRRGGKQIATVILTPTDEKEAIFTRWNNNKDPEYFADEVRRFLNLEKKQR